MSERLGCKRKVAWEKAVLALIETGSTTQAAQEIGVARRTLSTWQRDPDFQALYSQARSELLSAGLAGLHGLLSDAAKALRMALNDPAASHRDRLRAAEIVFDRAVKAHELFEIEKRLSALEQAQLGDNL